MVGISKSLEGDAYVSLRELSTQFFVLSKEAEQIVQHGSQEILVLAALVACGEGGMSMPELQEKVGKDVCKIGMGNCLKNKWARKEKDGRLVAVAEGVKDEVRDMLGKLKEGAGAAGVLEDKVRQWHSGKVQGRSCQNCVLARHPLTTVSLSLCRTLLP